MRFNRNVIICGGLLFVFQVVFVNRLPLPVSQLNLFFVFLVLSVFYGSFFEALILGAMVGFFQDLYSSGYYFYWFLYPFIGILVKEALRLMNGEEPWLPYAVVGLFSLVFYLAGFFVLYVFTGQNLFWPGGIFGVLITVLINVLISLVFVFIKDTANVGRKSKTKIFPLGHI